MSSSPPAIRSSTSSAGGSINGILKSLNYLLDLAIPKDKQEGGTYIIPGHGRLCDEADLLEYRDMITIIRDRIEDLVKKGRTLEQVKAAKPTLDYDGRYGATIRPLDHRDVHRGGVTAI